MLDFNSLQLMKNDDALKVLGHDRVNELFLQGNMAEMSSFCRRFIQAGEFYCVSPEKLGELLRQEVLWQAKVRESYKQHLVMHNCPVETKQESQLGI